ncbi:endo-beta-1 [Colletotrichum orchidophilum]|uniref:Endo-beta-1 n=1 Tax=Colletotrichum orchidophilum TaxID=1209926 RepID=A0A1G4B3Z0_9PEZI|nr:endo-beta-1 [Colletotrichum orchidophilum]OHE96043.1 endo-beta-1 [Colletotrichum orchidophilum]
MRRLTSFSALIAAVAMPLSTAAELSRRELQPLPLSVHDRYIVDARNETVALVGVNWAGHERTMLPEGLQYQSVAHIVKRIAETGFNAVRLTFATEMVDDIVEKGGDVDLKTTLQNALGPENGTAILKQILQNNPAFNESSKRLDVWDAVAAELGRQKIYVHLDNHVSKAGWCCTPYDGNGWFGDTNFNTSNWVRGLSYMAEHGKASNWTTFTSMGLRNELRDPFSGDPPESLENTTWTTWKTRMVQGANAIHAANPDVLIFFGGRIFDFDISAPVQGRFGSEPGFNFSIAEFPFKNKFVFEQHQYDQGLVDDACTSYRDILAAFGSDVMTSGSNGTNGTSNRAPLVMTEWGHDQSDESGAFKNKFRRCLMDFMVDRQISWMVWVMGGSYYTREGVQDKDEPWAILDHNWSAYRGKASIRKLQSDMEKTYEAFHQTMPSAGRSPGNQPKSTAASFSYSVSLATLMGIVVAVMIWA